MRRGLIGIGVGIALVAASSCIHIDARNDAYLTTDTEIDSIAQRMREAPVGVRRPVVVLSGYRSPSGSASKLAGDLRELTGARDEQFSSLGYMFADDIQPLGDVVVAHVDERWPTDDPERTTEVDVVAISMGGLVARWAAADRGDGSRRLRINTLYTLASPHRGAKLADSIRIDAASNQMRAGSGFLETLDGAFEERDYELVPYAVLRDGWVGATRAAPEGLDPIWVPGRVTLSHHLMTFDDRLITDIAARLRGEPALGEPSEPPHD